ncbi:MAG TPA: serine hydrolase domain-containing protein [Mucilaginibacter sp.]|nr:serine hydrolase domain-containing protein [Mucilaginibacter sp.]
MKLPRLVFLSILSAFCFQLHAQTINQKRLDSLFDALNKKNLAMGSIAISQNGKVVYRKIIGNAMMNEHDTIPASEKTEYRIGSITKMFTAIMVFQLIEEHKLSLHDTLAKFFPSLPNAHHVTIELMLRHRSGLPNFTNNNSTHFDDWKDTPKTHDELLAMISAQKPDFEPNAKADYNNSNYLLLGYIIEKITKKPYRELLNERIIKKIDLKNTWYGINGSTYVGNECASYKYFDYKWVKDKKPAYLDNFSGAGAIISTPPDMLKFINALFDYKLVGKQSLDQMKIMVDGYGMGMFPYGSEKHPGFGHNGKTEGFSSSISYYPADKLAIAYCTNGEVYSKNYILDGIRAICFNEPYSIPTFNALKLSDQQLDQYAGTYSGPDGITVICSKNEGDLWLETRGQKLKLDALGDNKFFDPRFGFFFNFSNDNKKLRIIDVEDEYQLEKK